MNRKRLALIAVLIVLAVLNIQFSPEDVRRPLALLLGLSIGFQLYAMVRKS